MLCTEKPRNSIVGSSRLEFFNSLSFLGAMFVAFLVFGLSLYSSNGQAEEINDVSSSVDVQFEAVKGKWRKKTYEATVVVSNTSAMEISAPLRIIITEFKNKRHLLKNSLGVTDEGYSYIEIDLNNGVLGVGESTQPQSVVFKKMSSKAWKKWKKVHKTSKKVAAQQAPGDSPGWSEHNFPIKFNYLVDGNTSTTEVSISQPDAVPGALQVNNGEVDVRFTLSVLTNLDQPLSSVLLKGRPFNNDDNCADDDECCDYYDEGCGGCDYYDECCGYYNEGCGGCDYYDECCDYYDDGCGGCEYYNDCGNCDGCTETLLNDDGINGDEEANDGIYSAITTIDTDELESGECRSYVGTGVTEGNLHFESEEYLLCATDKPTELFISNARDANIITLENGAEILGDELMVRFDPGASTEEFEKYLRSIRGVIVGTQLGDGLYQIAFDAVRIPAEMEELILLLSDQENVIEIVPNYVGEFTSIPSDPEFFNQHGLRLLSADSLNNEDPRYVWDAGATGAGTQVIVLDSGIISGHPDNLDPKSEFGKDTNDQVGHGTQMAGIIGAPTDNGIGVAAMARDTRLRSVRVAKTSKVTLANMLDGFKRAKGYAGRNKIISASFSIKNMLSDGGICNQINKIINRGAVVVVSAGNDNRNSETGIVPANCNSSEFDIFTRPRPVSTNNKQSLIVVGASGCSDGSCEEDSRWIQSNGVGSNFGDWVDISAPGVNIPTTNNDGGYTVVSGTSASTAFVAGAAAILRSCQVGGSLDSSDGSSLELSEVLAAMNIGATTQVDNNGAPRLNLYDALASVNTVPSNIVLSETQLEDGTDTDGGLAFAEIGFSDDTVCDAHSFHISGGEDATSFSIGGDQGDLLVIDAGTLDASVKSSYQVEVTVSDFYGETSIELLTIQVLD